ncbi:MAG: TfoX/Sxy family DNA transformation protein, partial [Enterobacteriaceae bacterium]
ITSPDKLKQHGAIGAYLLLEEKLARGMSVNVLLALHGAIKGCHVAVLPEDDRALLFAWWREYSGYRGE